MTVTVPWSANTQLVNALVEDAEAVGLRSVSFFFPVFLHVFFFFFPF